MALRWEPTHVTKHSPRISPYRSCLEGRELTLCLVSLTGSWRKNRGLRVVLATYKSFSEMFTQI